MSSKAENNNKIILDLCGGTGAWSRPYVEAGYDVRLVTLPENDVRGYQPPENVYGILAAPPCTMFSFARTNPKASPRNLQQGMNIVYDCLAIIWGYQLKTYSDHQKLPPLKFWCLENPFHGMLRWFMGKPAYTFTPWEFGDNYKKQTALWGHFKDPVKTHQDVRAVMSDRDIEKSKTNSRKLPKFENILSKDIHPELFGKLNRQARRSITPTGFANAFFKANQ